MSERVQGGRRRATAALQERRATVSNEQLLFEPNRFEGNETDCNGDSVTDGLSAVCTRKRMPASPLSGMTTSDGRGVEAERGGVTTVTRVAPLSWGVNKHA